MSIFTLKHSCVLEAPVLNRSGYGTYSDDVFHALNGIYNLDLKVVPVSWGSCIPKTQIRDRDKVILEKIPKTPIERMPDLFVSVNLPHNTEPKGIFNVNVSAIVEVDKATNQIVQGLNKYNLSIVCSQFSKDVLLNSDIKPTLPIEVCHWGCDTNTYKFNAPSCPNVDAELSKIKEDEVFLFVGQVTHPYLFKDRKDMDTLIKTFCETFKDKNIALVLKTNGTNFSTYDRNTLLERIEIVKKMAKSNVSVYLLHGELSEFEMAALYSHPKVIAHISFSHGEGFSMPLLQGSLSGKPTFAPNWSAPTEFLDKLNLFDGELKVIPKDIESEYFCAGSKWFYLDLEKTKEKLLHFFLNRQIYNEAALKLADNNKNQFSLEAMNNRIKEILTKHFTI